MDSSLDIPGDTPGKRPRRLHQALDPEQWVAQHGDPLFRYAILRLQNSDLAESIVQETFLAALYSRDKFAGHASERTWLIAILRHKLMDYLRRSSRECPVSWVESTEKIQKEFFDERGTWTSTPRDWGTDPSMLLEQKQFWEVLTRCLSALPPRQAEAFWLREMEGVSSEEICEVLKVSTKNLWVMLYRARLQLRRHLEKQWFRLAE
jgi:RNA polymerase sigma-70 factor (ECF subfamily)